MLKKALAGLLCACLPSAAEAGASLSNVGTTGLRVTPAADLSLSVAPETNSSPDLSLPQTGDAPPTLVPAPQAGSVSPNLSQAPTLGLHLPLGPAAVSAQPPLLPADRSGPLAATPSSDPAAPSPSQGIRGVPRPAAVAEAGSSTEDRLAGSQVLSRTRAAMELQNPELGPVYDNSGTQAPPAVAPEPGKDADAAQPRKRPAGAPVATRAEFLSVVYDLHGHRALSDAARAQMFSAIYLANERRDVAFLRDLTFLALHDARTRTTATKVLREMPFDEEARRTLRIESERLAQLKPFTDAERLQTAERLLARADLYSVARDQSFDKILVKGSLFDPAFIREERARAKARKTVAFDLEGTWARYDPERGWELLPGIEDVFRRLQSQGIRLALWSTMASPVVKTLFDQHPEMLDYFDVAMLGDSTYDAVINVDSVRGAYEGADWDKVKRYYDSFADPPAKDIALFGHALLVDNAVMEGAENSPLGAFRVHRAKLFAANARHKGEDTKRLADKILGFLKQPALDAPAPASVGDLAGIVGLLKPEGLLREMDGGERALRRKIESDPGSVLVLKREGEVIGVVVTVYDPWASFIRQIAVAARYRGLGLGHVLAEAAERRLLERGTTSVNSYVPRRDERALQFFERRDFQVFPSPVLALEKPLGGRIPAAAAARDAAPADIPRLIELLKATGLFWEIGDKPEVLLRKLEFDPGSILALERDGRIVGMAMTLYDAGASFIWHVAVDPGYQGRGLGDALVSEAQARLAARSTASITAYVLPGNGRSLSLFGKHGYIQGHAPLTAIEKPLP